MFYLFKAVGKMNPRQIIGKILVTFHKKYKKTNEALKCKLETKDSYKKDNQNKKYVFT